MHDPVRSGWVLAGLTSLASCSHVPPVSVAATEVHVPAVEGSAPACPEGLTVSVSTVEPALLFGSSRLGYRLEVEGMPFALENRAMPPSAAIGDQPVMAVMLPVTEGVKGFSGLVVAPPAAGSALSAGYMGEPTLLRCVPAEILVLP